MAVEPELVSDSFFSLHNRLAPEWKKAANNLKGLVTVAAVNCDEETNRPLCGQYQIKGFPTIKTFHPDRRVDKKTGATAKKPKGNVITSWDHHFCRRTW